MKRSNYDENTYYVVIVRVIAIYLEINKQDIHDIQDIRLQDIHDI